LHVVLHHGGERRARRRRATVGPRALRAELVRHELVAEEEREVVLQRRVRRRQRLRRGAQAGDEQPLDAVCREEALQVARQSERHGLRRLQVALLHSLATHSWSRT
jgi:hypothetical protein